MEDPKLMPGMTNDQRRVYAVVLEDERQSVTINL
jgi:hypothetical protein